MNKKQIKTILFFLLDWIWCFPQTLLGFIISRTLWKDSYNEWLISAEFYTSVRIGEEKEGFLYNYLSGFSLGRYICLHKEYYDEAELEKTVRHECGHTLQSRRLGPLYLLAVGIPSAYGNLKARKDSKRAETYYEHYPEKWADTLGGVKR